MQDLPSFGQWLRQRRREMDLTQAALARQVGCAAVTIRKLEADEMRPSKELAELLAKHLGIPVQERETFIRLARSGQPPQPLTSAASRHNLPAQLGRFIGREREIHQLRQLHSRLVTLTGVGGVGKTTLALQLASQQLEDYRDGVWLVELASLSDPALIPHRIGNVLGLQEGRSNDFLSALIDSLRLKNSLLVLDNCEHLIQACAQFVEALLKACPTINVLATSREPLHVFCEQNFPVPPLTFPDFQQISSLPTEMRLHLADYDAVQLFLDRASKVKPGFSLTLENGQSIAQIVAQLDGIPLAIEMAAARVTVLTVEEIAARLDDRYRLLMGTRRTALPRHQTLRAALDWSHDLLSPSERILFRRLAIFTGGCTLEAAGQICAGDGIREHEMLDLLMQLVDKSLLTVHEHDHKARYQMLETIRQYAWDNLIGSGESDRVQDLFLHYWTVFARQNDSRFDSDQQAHCLDQFELEHDNLRTALQWALGLDAEQIDHNRQTAAAELTSSLGRFWLLRGYWTEGRKWLERALGRFQKGDRTREKGLVLSALGGIYKTLDDYSAFERVEREAISIFRDSRDIHSLYHALYRYGWARLERGDPEGGRAAFAECADLARQMAENKRLATSLWALGAALERIDLEAAKAAVEQSLALERQFQSPGQQAYSLRQLGDILYLQGDYASSLRLCQEAAVLLQKINHRYELPSTLVGIAEAALRLGDVNTALQSCVEALAIARDPVSRYNIAETLIGFAGVASALRQARRSILLLASAQALYQSVGLDYTAWPSTKVRFEDHLAEARAELDAETCDELWREGLALTMEDVVQLALQDG